ncbi:2,5-phosphodiesterase [Trypanosoma theileri]|uniref:2,5-phosphodiesterase n=1 Tax=Trypanosoma theileri TaxID=67003 RepID=A0A1X0PAG3_9TRYP|nr:2,5-phosphodiesterase [Trypanosoma theileri]ORC93613.1 2,5-phosphodiesterase [Trypanosoma theileri]
MSKSRTAAASSFSFNSASTSSTAAASKMKSSIVRMAREPNTAVVLHPLNSSIITLDLCIQLDASKDTLWQKNMARDENEIASKTLARLQILISQQKGEKINKRTTREEILENCQAIEVRGVDSNVDLEKKDSISNTNSLKVLDTSLPNKDFWKYVREILIGTIVVRVKYNVPTITSVVPPSALYVGLPAVCSGITTLFTSETDVRYEWCIRSCGKNEKDSMRVISTDAVFTPLEEHIGNLLLLRVSPAGDSDLWTQIDLPPVRSALPYLERWKQTSLPVKAPAFRVVTYNVLHDEFCSKGSAKKRIYPFATDEILSLDNRKVRIIQELLAYHADIICLQECGKSVFQQFFERTLRHQGYDGHYTNKNGGIREGCACFYKRSRFSLVEKHSFPLNWSTLQEDHPDLAARIIFFPEFREALDNITSIGTVLLLKDLHTNEKLLVGNTHLFYHANACHIRLLQIYMLLHKLKSLSELQSLPVVLCGDFNFTHITGGYRLVTAGRTEASHPSWDKGELFHWGCDRLLGISEEEAEEGIPTSDENHPALPPITKTTTEKEKETKTEKDEEMQVERQPPFVAFREDLDAPLQLTDAYGLTDPNLPWTNYTMTFREVIDYIFFSPSRLSVLRTVPIPAESELSQNVALPNKLYPSDHIALIADLTYKPQESSS